MKVEKDEFLIDNGKSVMMTMRRRPLADCSRPEVRQPERCQITRFRCHTSAMKLFRSTDINVVHECRLSFNFMLASEKIEKEESVLIIKS